MKQIIIIALAIMFVFSACTKKVPASQCYVCQRYELVYAPIFIQYNQPRKLVSIDTVCNMNDALIQLYMTSHNHLDTIMHGAHNDTIILNQHSSICDIE